VESQVKTTCYAAAAISNASYAFPEADGFVSIRDVARRTSMSEKSVRNIIRDEALPHYRRSRSGKIWLRWTDFAEWMERRRIELKRDDSLLDILRDMARKAPRS
jgi:predicted DNA-binding transcriptional regulator AlpA